jgi:hypothetical protein
VDLFFEGHPDREVRVPVAVEVAGELHVRIAVALHGVLGERDGCARERDRACEQQLVDDHGFHGFHLRRWSAPRSPIARRAVVATDPDPSEPAWLRRED